MGINLVHNRNVLDPAEWRRRHKENAALIGRLLKKHTKKIGSAVIFSHYGAKTLPTIYRDFFCPLKKAAGEFGKPVLFLHENGHYWDYQKGFLAKNITRVMVDPAASPLQKVIVTGRPGKPFVFPGKKLPEKTKPTGLVCSS